MTPIAAIFLLAAVALGIVLSLRLLRKAKYLACAEYFVYLPEETMPDQNALMDRVIKGGPYGQPITSQEGILFSDIRLHLGLILRSKNPHVFRPDTFETHIEPTDRILDDLSRAKSAVKVRYLSEEPLADKRHLQLLPYLTEAVAVLGGGQAIFDASAERLLRLEDLQKQLSDDSDATRSGLHLHVFSHPATQGIVVETRGLIKIGIAELRTRPIESDMRILAVAILEDAARQIWELGVLPDELEVEAYGDRFLVQIEPDSRPAEVQILRKQS